jgi:hypothetical protein
VKLRDIGPFVHERGSLSYEGNQGHSLSYEDSTFFPTNTVSVVSKNPWNKGTNWTFLSHYRHPGAAVEEGGGGLNTRCLDCSRDTRMRTNPSVPNTGQRNTAPSPSAGPPSTAMVSVSRGRANGCRELKGGGRNLIVSSFITRVLCTAGHSPPPPSSSTCNFCFIPPPLNFLRPIH